MSSDQFTSSLDLIKKNDPNEIKIVCETLLRILSNIQKSPNEAKLRKLSLESDDVLYNLMPYEGALEALFVIGFEEVCYVNKPKLFRYIINSKSYS